MNALPTNTPLRPSTLAALQELVQVNTDSSKGFVRASSITGNPRLRSLFRDLAAQRSRFAEQLKKRLRSHGESPERGGTWFGAAHRWWTDVRTQLSADAIDALLEEIERAADRIQEAYEELAGETAGSPIQALLVGQYGEIQKGRDRIRALRSA